MPAPTALQAAEPAALNPETIVTVEGKEIPGRSGVLHFMLT